MIPRTYGICITISEITSWKELKLVPSFSCSSLLLAWRSYILIKIEYAVALFHMTGNRMVQDDVNITYGFGLTPAGKKVFLFFLLSVSKKILRIKKGT